MNKIFLSVVVPAYNEEKSIRRGSLDEVYKYLKNQNYSWEVLLVDDGSTDSTRKFAETFSKNHKGFKVFAEPHRGKGGTVIAGMLKAHGDIVLFTDMDQATPMTEVAKLLPQFDLGYKVVIGSRTGRKGANSVRKLMAYGFALLRTAILRLPFRDTQCGFKAFRQSAIKPIFERLEVFRENQQVRGSAVTAGFDLEILYIARKLGYKIAEVGVEWMEKGNRSDSGVNPIKDSWEGLRDLVKVRINALSGKYRIRK